MKNYGIVACSGIGIGKPLILKAQELSIEKYVIKSAEEEINRFIAALTTTTTNLRELAKEVSENIGEEEAAIFTAHELICNDVEIFEQVKEMITNDLVNAEYAYFNITKNFAEIFKSMDDEYMKERALDIEDVSKRVLRVLLGIETVDLKNIDEDTIIVAHDLTPSETSQLNAKYIKAFITMIGGKTSHSAIIARSLEIPAIVGVNGEIEDYQADVLVVDALNNKIIANPNEEMIKQYQDRFDTYLEEKKEWVKFQNKPAKTIDGKHFEIACNIASLNDLEEGLANNADGIGLFRSEFLYMENDSLPSEELQLETYAKVLAAFPEQKVVIRTLDIGGDKNLPYFNLPEEMNPFLGVRAIRLCFEYKDIFKVQIRALLRANTFGNLCIMFPMIATVEEFLQAKEIVEECINELRNEGLYHEKPFQLGTMIEIPAAAIAADLLAKHVDFFSIGTNDLIQYTMAADRMNQSLNYLYQPLNPAIKRLISMVVDAAHQENKWVGMCGEMASDEEALPFLLSTGIDELSMNARAILRTKFAISKINTNEF